MGLNHRGILFAVYFVLCVFVPHGIGSIHELHPIYRTHLMNDLTSLNEGAPDAFDVALNQNWDPRQEPFTSVGPALISPPIFVERGIILILGPPNYSSHAKEEVVQGPLLTSHDSSPLDPSREHPISEHVPSLLPNNGSAHTPAAPEKFKDVQNYADAELTTTTSNVTQSVQKLIAGHDEPSENSPAQGLPQRPTTGGRWRRSPNFGSQSQGTKGYHSNVKPTSSPGATRRSQRPAVRPVRPAPVRGPVPRPAPVQRPQRPSPVQSAAQRPASPSRPTTGK